MPFHVSGQVREQVYETLRKQQHHQQHPTYSEVMTSSSGSSNCGVQSATGPPVITPKPTIKGIRSKLTLPTNPGSPPRAATRRHRDRSPPELPPPPQDISDLYAKVDRAKKKKNRESSESGSNACSPDSSEQHAQVSPTKSLIQKFNTLGQNGDQQQQQQQQEGGQQRQQTHAPSPARRQANPKMNLVANPIAASGAGGSQESLVKGQGEPMYATIGSKNRSQIASRFNSRPDNV